MRTAEQIFNEVVEETLKRIDKEVAELRRIIYAPPHLDLIKLHGDTIPKVMELSSAGKHKESIALLQSAQKEKKKLNALIRKQRNIPALISRCVELEHSRTEFVRYVGLYKFYVGDRS